jgi:hypothetical protein
LVLVAKIYGVGKGPNPVSGNKDTRMNADTLFRVEVVWSPPGDAGEALESEPISRFDQRTLMLLLSKSGESIGQEAESATFQQLQEGGSPIGELPQLSRIVNLLRGPVIYTAAEVRELQIECQRARGSLQDPQTKALLQDLDVASAKALAGC